MFRLSQVPEEDRLKIETSSNKTISNFEPLSIYYIFYLYIYHLL